MFYLSYEIVKEIRKLDEEDAIFLAWLCVVRILPFLEGNGQISSPKERRLYLVFQALDYIAFGLHTKDYDRYAVRVADIDTKLREATTNIKASSGYTPSKIFSAAAEATSAVVQGITLNNKAIIVNTVTDAVGAAIVTATPAVQKIISQDMKILEKKQYSKLNCDISIYGNKWVNFLKGLDKIGCGYWGRLYTDIFKNGFDQNMKDIERRLLVPEEIWELGAKKVADYLEQQDKHGSKHLNEARIIILGEKGAGKTCLARRLKNLNSEMTTDSESTLGVETSIWEIEEENNNSAINAHIWDFAGHVITHAAHRCFLSERCLYIIVYDGRTETRNRIEYWLDHVKNYGGDAPVIIVVNEKDSNHIKIPINRLKKDYPFLKDKLFNLSIKNDLNKLEELRAYVTALIRENPSWNNQTIPANYFRAKENVSSYFQDNTNKHEIIQKNKFIQIIKNNVIENTEELLTALHALGICLWYKDLAEFNMLVLNPEWISNGVYTIINWASNNDKFRVNLNDYAEIFTNQIDRYPKDKLSFIFKLMEKYELAFSQSREPNTIVIPFLLQDDRPDEEDIPNLDGSLMIQYVADSPLPPNTVSRLIVRHNREICNGKVWSSGVVLKYGHDTYALVEENDRKVIVNVKGAKCTKYISLLRNTLNDIFNSYRSRSPELQYKLIDDNQIAATIFNNQPLMISASDLIDLERIGRDYLYIKENREIPILPTIRGYNVTVVVVKEGGIYSSGSDATISQNNFNFEKCNIGLQGDLNALMRQLSAKNEGELADELKDIICDLDESKGLSKEEIIKGGFMNNLKNFLEEMGDDKSAKRKVIDGVKYGVKTMQEIAKKYNSVAEWVGLPVVPKILLGTH